MRDVLIHHYFGVKLETVWQVVIDYLPSLSERVQHFDGVRAPLSLMRRHAAILAQSGSKARASSVRALGKSSVVTSSRRSVSSAPA